MAFKRKTKSKQKTMKDKVLSQEVVVTPPGVASFPSLSKPDEGGQYSDGKYKVTLKFDKEELDDAAEKFLDAIEDAHEEAIQTEIKNSKKKLTKKVVQVMELTEAPLRDGDDTEKEENHGFYLLTPKTQFQPALVDSKRNPLPKSVKIGPGDLIKAALVFKPYLSSGLKKAGLTVYLQAVQLIEKNNSGGVDAEAAVGAFGDEDGYEAEDVDDDDEVEDEDDGDEGDF